MTMSPDAKPRSPLQTRLKARAAVREHFPIERMAAEMAALFGMLTPNLTKA